jgi:hypothetical protein
MFWICIIHRWLPAGRRTTISTQPILPTRILMMQFPEKTKKVNSSTTE